MTNMRVQCSLLIEDEDLYVNFIKPLKNNRELHGTIIKVLKAYYKNPQVRALVDELDGKAVEMESNEFDSIFNAIRQTVATCSFLADAASDELQNGETVIREFVDSVAENTGGTASTDTEFGVMPPQFNSENLKKNVQKAIVEKVKDTTQEEGNINNSTSNNNDFDSRLTKIEDTLSSLVSILNANPDNIKNLQKTSSLSNSNENLKVNNDIDGFLNVPDKQVVKEEPKIIESSQSESDTIDGSKYFDSIFEENEWLN